MCANLIVSILVVEYENWSASLLSRYVIQLLFLFSKCHNFPAPIHAASNPQVLNFKIFRNLIQMFYGKGTDIIIKDFQQTLPFSDPSSTSAFISADTRICAFSYGISGVLCLELVSSVSLNWDSYHL